MKCPFCRVDNDRVIDSRSSQDGLAIRRRRECVACGRRLTTYERPEETTIKVIKKDGSRVPFEREKIKRGLERACWKRPINSRQIETTTTAIENDVYQQFESEVQSRQLGDLVMRYLRDLDEVAFVRFASVYRQFKTLEELVGEAQAVIDAKRFEDPSQGKLWVEPQNGQKPDNGVAAGAAEQPERPQPRGRRKNGGTSNVEHRTSNIE